jgi:hypothetical protein
VAVVAEAAEIIMGIRQVKTSYIMGMLAAAAGAELEIL